MARSNAPWNRSNAKAAKAKQGFTRKPIGSLHQTLTQKRHQCVPKCGLCHGTQMIAGHQLTGGLAKCCSQGHRVAIVAVLIAIDDKDRGFDRGKDVMGRGDLRGEDA